MRIATWNINSIIARLPRLLAWLESSSMDVLCLQETKCTAEQFPAEALRELGYESAVTPPAGGTVWRCSPGWAWTT